jgi:hypothetical protein
MTQNTNKQMEQVFEQAKNLYKRDQLAAARASLAEKGKSPREIGHESLLKVIQWIYRWGYTTTSIIQVIVNRTSGGYANKLTNQGWLVYTKTSSGTPAGFYTLSEKGLAEAERHTQLLYNYQEINPYRVDQLQIRHNILAQSASLNGLKAGTIISYESERMLFVEGDKFGQKRPDVVWIAKSGLRIGVEIELSAKWGQKLDEFILRIAAGLTSVEGKSATYDRLMIASDSPAIISRYQDAVKPGALVSSWKKSPRNHWIQDKTEPVADWLISKVDFYLIKK